MAFTVSRFGAGVGSGARLYNKKVFPLFCGGFGNGLPVLGCKALNNREDSDLTFMVI